MKIDERNLRKKDETHYKRMKIDERNEQSPQVK
jgi:hypothetical protein